MTQAEIAVKAGVSRRTVTSVVADRKPKNAQVAQSTSKTQGNSSSATSDSKPESNDDPEVSLSEQVKKLKNLIQQHIDKAVRLVDDLHDLKPNKTRQQAVIKALQDIKLW
jgi:organic radical activating enzyme